MNAAGTPGRTRLATFAALAVASLAIGFALAAPAAQSAPSPKYKVDICKDFNWLNLVYDVVYSPVFSVYGDCNWDKPPYDVPFSAVGENDGTEEGAWEYPFHTGPHHDGLELTKITTMMYGSDGSANGAYQGLRVCASGCGDLITLSQPSLPSPDDWEQQSYAVGSAQVPEDSYWIRFVGNCVTIPCGPTEPIRFLKIELEYSETTEDSAPRTEVSKRDTTPYTFARTVDFGWVNSPFTFHWRASDVGAGLTQVRWASARGGNGTVYDHCKNSIENAYLCPLNASGPVTIDPTSEVVWKEGPQSIVVDATDRVGLRASSRVQLDQGPAIVTFKIDRTAPTPTSLAVSGKGSTGWASNANTDLVWDNVGEEYPNATVEAPASGVVAARFDFDPAEPGQPNPPAQTVTGENIESAEATIPGPGLWAVSVRTIDAVGNESVPMNTVVGLDGTTPDGAFDDVDPERPTLIAATVADAHSDIESAVIEYRGSGSLGGWSPLTTRVDRFVRGAARLTARFPDASLPDGSYDLRVSAVDTVGNHGLIVSRSDGATAKIVTPVRSLPKIKLGFEKRVPARCARKKSRSCPSKSLQLKKTVEFGRGAIVSGLLENSARKPLANMKVKLYTSRGGPLQRRELGEVMTGRDGQFRSFVPAGTNRLVTARFQGTELIKPSEATIEMFTRAKIGIRVNRKRIRSGQRFVIRGRLATGGEKIGALDLPMSVRVLGTKLSFSTSVRPDGTYRVVSDRLSTRRPIQLLLQAHFPQQAGWPYANGESRVLRVTVVP